MNLSPTIAHLDLDSFFVSVSRLLHPQLKGKPKEILGRDYLVSDYAEAAKGLNVTKSVYMEVDVAEADQVKEAEFVTKVCADGSGADVPIDGVVPFLRERSGARR